MSIRIAELYLFPVKSCAPIRVERFSCSEAGPYYDREWMIVGPDRKFLTQRELPTLALVQPEIDQAANGLRLRMASRAEAAFCSFSLEDKTLCEVEVWSQLTKAYDMGDECALWLSAVLGREVRLVRISPENRKQTQEQERTIRFADSYPLHLCSLSSLADLNSRLASPIEILRFRPNIVIEGSDAWAEDKWAGVKFRDQPLKIGKACARCITTNVNPLTGTRGTEPLKTLASFRRNARNKIEFGQYLHSQEGVELCVGMEVSPISAS